MQFQKKRCVAMLLAGGQGSRLMVLTENTAKPAVPFGGKYRIIDFPLSNCVNSKIDTVGILTQYQPLELNEYIGNGQPWGLNSSHGGVQVLPPYAKSKNSEWYKGTANAIYQNIPFIERYNPDNVLILSGDHIYKMDYAAMLRFHEQRDSDCTIAVREVPLKEASRFGIMNTREDGSIYEFEEKPKKPKSTNASMGIYVFKWSVLKAFLEADEADRTSENDFGKNIIPAILNAGHKLYAYRFEGYLTFTVLPVIRFMPEIRQCRQAILQNLPRFGKVSSLRAATLRAALRTPLSPQAARSAREWKLPTA